ncbi:hypothetical protein BGZ73_008660 [Actinomortierella ambigua]|nr:hypothetical protein BGZ73_008660 [Actinomortierella ambigua]
MDLLRGQEWRLLFASKQQSASNTPPALSDATLLVKGYFAPASHFYLVMVTDLQQCWVEKMEREDIRERSMSIKTFDYEDDSQLEELLKTLESMFSKGHTPPATRHLKIGDNNSLELRDEFKYGIANAEWSFNLSPTMGQLDAGLPKRTNTGGRELWDRPAFDKQYPSFLNRNARQREQSTMDSDLQEDEEDGDILNGPLLMYENVSLPLITVLNAYRKQVRILENVIKSKETEVKELVDLLDVNGISHQQRLRATEPYRPKDVESPAVVNVRADVRRQNRPAATGPWDLFSDAAIQSLCSIVSKNAANKSLHHPSQVPSSLDSLSQPLSQNPLSSQVMESLRSGTQSLRSEGQATPAPEQPASPRVDKQTKAEQEELERRKKLQERLERERIEREKKPKRKKLF